MTILRYVGSRGDLSSVGTELDYVGTSGSDHSSWPAELRNHGNLPLAWLILSFLDLASLRSLARACKEFRWLVTDVNPCTIEEAELDGTVKADRIWRHLLLNRVSRPGMSSFQHFVKYPAERVPHARVPEVLRATGDEGHAVLYTGGPWHATSQLPGVTGTWLDAAPLWLRLTLINDFPGGLDPSNLTHEQVNTLGDLLCRHMGAQNLVERWQVTQYLSSMDYDGRENFFRKNWMPILKCPQAWGLLWGTDPTGVLPEHNLSLPDPFLERPRLWKELCHRVPSDCLGTEDMAATKTWETRYVRPDPGVTDAMAQCALTPHKRLMTGWLNFCNDELLYYLHRGELGLRWHLSRTPPERQTYLEPIGGPGSLHCAERVRTIDKNTAKLKLELYIVATGETLLSGSKWALADPITHRYHRDDLLTFGDICTLDEGTRGLLQFALLEKARLGAVISRDDLMAFLKSPLAQVAKTSPHATAVRQRFNSEQLAKLVQHKMVPWAEIIARVTNELVHQRPQAKAQLNALSTPFMLQEFRRSGSGLTWGKLGTQVNLTSWNPCERRLALLQDAHGLVRKLIDAGHLTARDVYDTKGKSAEELEFLIADVPQKAMSMNFATPTVLLEHRAGLTALADNATLSEWIRRGLLNWEQLISLPESIKTRLTDATSPGQAWCTTCTALMSLQAHPLTYRVLSGMTEAQLGRLAIPSIQVLIEGGVDPIQATTLLPEPFLMQLNPHPDIGQFVARLLTETRLTWPTVTGIPFAQIRAWTQNGRIEDQTQFIDWLGGTLCPLDALTEGWTAYEKDWVGRRASKLPLSTFMEEWVNARCYDVGAPKQEYVHHLLKTKTPLYDREAQAAPKNLGKSTHCQGNT